MDWPKISVDNSEWDSPRHSHYLHFGSDPPGFNTDRGSSRRAGGRHVYGVESSLPCHECRQGVGSDQGICSVFKDAISLYPARGWKSVVQESSGSFEDL